MKLVRRFLRRYFNSWWLPICVGLTNLVILLCMTFPRIGSSTATPYILLTLLKVMLILLAASFLGLVITTLWSLWRRRWIKLLSDILMLLLFSGAVYISLLLLFAESMKVGEENFSDRRSAPTLKAAKHTAKRQSTQLNKLQHTIAFNKFCSDRRKL